jgi:hypothetical protein
MHLSKDWMMCFKVGLGELVFPRQWNKVQLVMATRDSISSIDNFGVWTRCEHAKGDHAKGIESAQAHKLCTDTR